MLSMSGQVCQGIIAQLLKPKKNAPKITIVIFQDIISIIVRTCGAFK